MGNWFQIAVVLTALQNFWTRRDYCLPGARNVSEHYFLISLRDFKLEKHDSHEFSLFQKINLMGVCDNN